MTDTPKLNSSVVTPNGPGVVQGTMFENGTRFVMVRHAEKITQGKGGRPWHNGPDTSLWVYEKEEVTQ